MQEPSTPHPSPALPLGPRLDPLPLTWLHLAAVAVCALGLFADIAEVALGNVLAAVYTAPPHGMTRSELSLLLASVFAGGALGAPLLGALADRYGRRAVMQIALAAIALSSFAAAASSGVSQLTASRFLSGFAIGAYPPLTAAYLSDILPARWRGVLVMVCAGLAFLGAPAIILLVRGLGTGALGVEAWRWGLAAGGVLAGLGGALLALLPDPPGWLGSRGRRSEAEASCRRLEHSPALRVRGPGPAGGVRSPDGGAARPEEPDIRPASLRRRTLFLAGLYLLGPWATLGFPLLSAAVMVAGGFTLPESILFAGLSMFGPSLGILVAAPMIDRLDRRRALCLCAGAMIAASIAFPLAAALPVLVLLGLAFNLASALYSAVLALYAAEMFPSAVRASATANAWAAGRLVSIAVPLVLVPLLSGYGPTALFAAMASAVVASLALILAAGPPGTPARALG